VKEKLLSINPADAVQLPRLTKKEMKTLSMEDIKRFLETARNNKYYNAYYPAYLLELYSGLRRGELLGLRWKDIDFKEGKIRVFQQLVYVGSKHVIRDLKTEASKRVIAVPEEVLEVLKEHKKNETDKSNMLGMNDIAIKQHFKDGLVFTNAEGRLIRTDHLKRNFNGLLKAAKLEKIRFHDMRHTFALLSLQQGVDIKTLQSDLGHESIETTLDRYGHVNEEMKREAANKRSGLLKAMM
jgi:integrase